MEMTRRGKIRTFTDDFTKSGENKTQILSKISRNFRGKKFNTIYWIFTDFG